MKFNLGNAALLFLAYASICFGDSLSSPVLISPADGAYNASANETFIWDTVPRAKMYVLILTENADTALIYEYDTVLVNNYQTTLKKSASYWWQVVAYSSRNIVAPCLQNGMTGSCANGTICSWSAVRAIEIVGRCPSLYDTLFIKTDTVRFGKWRLNNNANYGSWDGQGNGTHLISNGDSDNCGWSIYGTYNGGYGNTFVASDSSLYFIWAWNMLSGLIVSSQWRGQTPEGIHIGSSLADFKKAYTGFQYLNTANAVNCRKTVNAQFPRPVYVHFDNDTLSWINCGYYTVPGFEIDNLAWPDSGVVLVKQKGVAVNHDHFSFVGRRISINSNGTPVSLNIFDESGRKLAEIHSGSGQINYDLIAKGVFICKIQTDKALIVKKLAVVR